MDFDVYASYWKEVFNFFKWKNFKLFGLASLNNFRRSLLLVGTHFWFVIALILGIKLYFLTQRMLMRELFDIAIGIGLFFHLLAARPSVGLKDKSYFLSHLGKIWIFLLFFLFLPKVLFPFFVLATLFFLDMDFSVESLLHSFKNSFVFCVSCFPTLVTISLGFSIPIYLISYVDAIFSMGMVEQLAQTTIIEGIVPIIILPTIATTLLMLVQALFISACTIYYVKIKHARHNLFFEK